jgi:hypothetical protein
MRLISSAARANVNAGNWKTRAETVTTTASMTRVAMIAIKIVTTTVEMIKITTGTIPTNLT